MTQLRRHQDNYHVRNIDPSKPEFVLNICGPLVAADVNSTNCSPHSACALDGDSYKVSRDLVFMSFHSKNMLSRVWARQSQARGWMKMGTW